MTQLCEKENRNMERFGRMVDKYFEEKASAGAFSLKGEREMLAREVQENEERVAAAKKEVSVVEQRLAGICEENRRLQETIANEERKIRQGTQSLQNLQSTRQQDCNRLQVSFCSVIFAHLEMFGRLDWLHWKEKNVNCCNKRFPWRQSKLHTKLTRRELVFRIKEAMQDMN